MFSNNLIYIKLNILDFMKSWRICVNYFGIKQYSRAIRDNIMNLSNKKAYGYDKILQLNSLNFTLIEFLMFIHYLLIF